MIHPFAIADVDAVAREDEPVRPLPTPKPRPRVAGPWHDAAGALVRCWGRRVVAQIIYRRDAERWFWVTEGASGLTTLQWDARNFADRALRRARWKLEP